MNDDRHTLVAGPTTATVLAHGAELCSIVQHGHEAMWQAGPAWPRHAPMLFPIVGALAGDRLTLADGRHTTMGKHGFARDLDWQFTHRTPDACTLRLDDTAETRAVFPWAFRLELAYALAPGVLRVRATVTNTGDAALPCSMGFHPAFRWPLDGTDKGGHRIELSDPEADTLAQIDSDGLIARRVANRLDDHRVLALADAVFAHDALIFDPLRSTAARYVAPSGACVTVGWDGAAQLGIWSKPADFVCIEPWRGHSDPVGYDGLFTDKPGLMHIAPGASEALGMTIAVDGLDAGAV